MNSIDIAVIVVLLASAIFALMRGFVYEVLAMAGWVLAALSAFWGVRYVRPLIHPYIANQTIADLAGGGAIFLAVLLISSFITHGISRQVRKSPVSAVDRSLGFAFGLVRGVVLASLVFMLVTKMMAPDEPEILTAAKTRPLLAVGARMIQALLPSGRGDIEAKARAVEAAAKNEIFENLVSPKPKGGEDKNSEKQPNYDKNGMERLIESTSGK